MKVNSRVAHGSHKRVERELAKLGYGRPNLSAIERQNGTGQEDERLSGQEEFGLLPYTGG